MDSSAAGPTIRVGIGEMKVARPPGTITAVGIGSCVVVVIRDDMCAAAGVAHIMLPWAPRRAKEGTNLLKYADHAIEQMVEWIIGEGGARKRLSAKVVGGAHMFDQNRSSFPLNIGTRNLEAVRRKLAQMGIPIRGEESGGNRGRSVEMNLLDGSVRVRTVRSTERVI